MSALGSTSNLALAGRLARQCQKNRILSQLHRFWLPYERDTVASGQEYTQRNIDDGVYFDDYSEIINKAAGRTGQPSDIINGMETLLANKNAHFHNPESFKLADDGASFTTDLKYFTEPGAGGESKSYTVNYDGKVGLTDSLLPPLKTLSIAGDPSSMQDAEYKSAYAENRAMSLVYYWLSLVEEASNPATNASLHPKVAEVIADDFEWNGTGSTWTSAQDVINWMSTLPDSLYLSTHAVQNDYKVEQISEDRFTVDMRFDWEGIAANGVGMVARTHHQWVLLDDPSRSLPLLHRANVDLEVPFQPAAAEATPQQS